MRRSRYIWQTCSVWRGIPCGCVITIAALFSAGLYPQLKSHLILGKAHGITKQEAVEIVTQLAFYCGWPKAWSTFPMIDEVWPDKE